MEAGTIAAIATPPGSALRAVVRASGPRARVALEGLLVEPGTVPAGRAAFGARVDDGRGVQPALVLWMPGPHSYTREDVFELHLPGAAPLVQRVLERLLGLGLRTARPGEFTRRAFENGRLDLTRAEGVLELIAARDEAECRAASALLFGGLERRVAWLREGLVELRSLCEASLDFEESDTGAVPRPELVRLAGEALARLEEARGWESRRVANAGLPRLALAGAPNAGKSTLFNALVPAARALVSEVEGTTRDGLRGRWTVAGAPVELFDLPGHSGPAVGVAAEAQARALEEWRSADLVLWVVSAEGATLDALLREDRLLADCADRLLVWSQVDRPGALSEPPPELEPALRGVARVSVAAPSGIGLGALEWAVARSLGLLEREPGGGSARPAAAAEGGGLGRELSARHRQALEDALAALREASTLLSEGTPLDLVAEALRAATDPLDAIAGQTTPEDLLDHIFSRFCIGK